MFRRCCGRGPEGASFGVHDISLLGGVSLIANTILGSGMVQIPSLFQQSGWLLPTLVFLLAAGGTAAAALLLARAVTKVPGNSDLSQRVEYARLMGSLLPRWAAAAGMVLLIVSFIAQNISNIILSAQVADDALLAAAHRTCGLVFYPPQPSGSPWLCISADSDSIITDSPFGPGVYALSIGYVIVAALTLPLSYLSLDNNIVFQMAGMALILVCEVVWLANLAALGLSADSLTVLSPQASSDGWLAAYSGILPTVLFNYGFVAAIPSWLNEKGPAVKTSTTIVISVVLATVLYLALGIVGAASVLDFSSNADLLSLLASTDGVWTVSKVAVFVFPAAKCVGARARAPRSCAAARSPANATRRSTLPPRGGTQFYDIDSGLFRPGSLQPGERGLGVAACGQRDRRGRALGGLAFLLRW
jgi:hypothetical protein